jgi:hypothetical protein
MKTTRYFIHAILLCHDIRLNMRIQLTADMDHCPDEHEAEQLLWPVAESEVANRQCEDCPYQIYGIEVEQEKPAVEAN